MNICVYGASSNTIDKIYIEMGEALGEEMAKRGHSLVFGGGANGLMGAVARGVSRFGGEIVGVVPSFFNVDGVLFDKCSEMIFTDTMRQRKQIMEERSDAFIMTPGGIGTFEEFFEILTSKQLARHSKAIAILNTNGFYDPIETFLCDIVDKNFMRPEATTLYSFFKEPKSLLDFLESYVPRQFSIEELKEIRDKK